MLTADEELFLSPVRLRPYLGFAMSPLTNDGTLNLTGYNKYVFDLCGNLGTVFWAFFLLVLGACQDNGLARR